MNDSHPPRFFSTALLVIGLALLIVGVVVQPTWVHGVPVVAVLGLVLAAVGAIGAVVRIHKRRKQEDRVPREPAAARRALVLRSAEATTSIVGTQAFYRRTLSTLKFSAGEFVHHLSERDQPGLFIPVKLIRDAETRPAALLVLEGRMVIVWIDRPRSRTYGTTITANAVTSVETSQRDGGTFSPSQEELVVKAPGADWSMIVDSSWQGGQRVTPFITNVLSGAMKPSFERPDARFDS